MISSKKNILLLFGILLLPGTVVMGQFDKTFNQYWLMHSYYNPASAGQDNKLNASLALNIHSMKWSRAPKTFLINADLPVTFWGMEHGVGAGMVTEKTGIHSNRRAWGQYVLKLKTDKGMWSFGIQGGILRMSIDSISATYKSSKFDVAAGILYSQSQFFLGISGHHLTSPEITLGDIDSLRVLPTLYFIGGYNIQSRNPLFSIQPSFHMQTDFESIKLNLTGRFSYTRNEKSFNGGVTWSPDTSVSLFIGAGFSGFAVGYAYELFTPSVDKVKGRHELLVRYSTVLNRQKKNKYKHQSIRVL